MRAPLFIYGLAWEDLKCLVFIYFSALHISCFYLRFAFLFLTFVAFLRLLLLSLSIALRFSLFVSFVPTIVIRYNFVFVFLAAIMSYGSCLPIPSFRSCSL